MTIIQLTPDDLPALTELEQKCQPLPWSEDQLLLELVHEDACVFGLFDAATLVGYVALRKMMEELWVLNLAVAVEQRRRGCAWQLMEHALSLAPQLDCASLWLEVREGNHAAVLLYHGLGLSERGRRPGYYPPIPPAQVRETAVLMSRTL
jgi:ribosomal-protein-alanine N-acetyltransferase